MRTFFKSHNHEIDNNFVKFLKSRFQFEFDRFRWMTSFLWNGYKTELQKEDLYEVLSEDDSKVIGDQLER